MKKSVPLWLCDENKVPLDDHQKELAVSVGNNLLIVAGPGSGKTRVLVSHYLHLLMSRSDLDVQNIAAITFTEKAAAEMKQRVQKILLLVAQEAFDQKDRERARYLLNRISQAPIGTIHSFCADLLRQYALHLGIDPSFTVLDEISADLLKASLADSLVTQVDGETNGKLGEALRTILQRWSPEQASRVLQILLRKKLLIRDDRLGNTREKNNWRLLIDDPDECRLLDKWILCFHALQQWYEDEKQKRNCLDFDDLLLKTWDLLQDPEILDEVRQQFAFILVDELQDVDAIQMNIIARIGGWEEGRTSFFGVGDPRQSIYRFRGAQVEELIELMNKFKPSGSVREMSRNYRSSQSIVCFLNYIQDRLFTDNQKMPRLQSDREEGDKVKVIVLVPEKRLFKFQRLRREASLIAQSIEKLVKESSQSGRTIRYKDVAVLLRDMVNVKVFMDAFRSAAIPYHILSGYGFFETQEVMDLITFLQAICEPDNDLALAAFLRSPLVGVSDRTLFVLHTKNLLNWNALLSHQRWDTNGFLELSDLEKKLLEQGRTLLREGVKRKEDGVVSVLEWLLTETDYEAILAALPHGKQALANVRKFIRLADEASRALNVTVHQVIRHLREIAKPEIRISEEPPQSATADAVQILTIHSSKGLEFPVVFVPMLGDITEPSGSRESVVSDPSVGAAIRYRDRSGELVSELPCFKAVDERRMEKEKEELSRLLFVACSRAKEELYLVGTLRPAGEAPDGGQQFLGKTVLEKVLSALGAENINGKWTLPKEVRSFVSLEQLSVDLEQEGIRPVTKSLGDHWIDNPQPLKKASLEESFALPIGSGPVLLPVSAVNNADDWHWDGGTLVRKGIGSLVHELVRRDLFTADEETVEKLSRKLGIAVRTADVPLVRQMVRKVANHPEWTRAVNSPDLYRECDFQVLLRDGSPYVLVGRWDLLYRHNGSWVVLDLKTDHIKAEAEAEKRCDSEGIYGVQIDAYAYAVHRLFQANEVTVRFLFLAPDPPIMVERFFKEEDWSATARRLEEKVMWSLQQDEKTQ